MYTSCHDFTSGNIKQLYLSVLIVFCAMYSCPSDTSIPAKFICKQNNKKCYILHQIIIYHCPCCRLHNTHCSIFLVHACCCVCNARAQNCVCYCCHLRTAKWTIIIFGIWEFCQILLTYQFCLKSVSNYGHYLKAYILFYRHLDGSCPIVRKVYIRVENSLRKL